MSDTKDRLGSIIMTGWCRDYLAEAYVRAIHAAYSGNVPRAPTLSQAELCSRIGQLWWAARCPRWPDQHETVDELLLALQARYADVGDDVGSVDDPSWQAVSVAIVAWRAAGFPGINKAEPRE